MNNPYIRRKKLSKSAKEQQSDPEVKDKKAQQQSERMTKLWKNPEFRDKMVAERKERWQDPEYKKKMSEIAKESSTDKVRKKISKSQKKNFKDKAYRERHHEMTRATAPIRSEKMKDNWNDPEFIYKTVSAKRGHDKALDVIEDRLGKEVRDRYEESL